MSILKVAHYYQVKLAQAGKHAFQQVLALQAEIGKITTIEPDIYESSDQRIVELAKKMQPINTEIINLKNKINSLVYKITKDQYIQSFDLKFRLDKIKEVILKLGMLGYSTRTANALSLANKIPIVNIDIAPEEKVDLPGVEISPNSTKEFKQSDSYGAGGAEVPSEQ